MATFHIKKNGKTYCLKKRGGKRQSMFCLISLHSFISQAFRQILKILTVNKGILNQVLFTH